MDESEVLVHIYEITNGLARALSPMFLGGKQIDGIWHTGIVVYNEEFYFGSSGIQSCKKGEFLLPNPNSVISLGKTEIPYEVLMDHLRELGSTTFRGSCYHLFDHNCNTFSNELANFLTGKGIPAEITNLPNEVKDTPIGAMIKQFIDNMNLGTSPMFGELEEGIGAQSIFDPIARAEDLRNSNPSNDLPVSSVLATSSSGSKTESSSCVLETFREKEPIVSEAVPLPIIYDDNSVLAIYQDRREMFKGNLRPNEFQNIEEVFEYLSLQEIDWSLCRNHIGLLCSLVMNISMTDELRSVSGRLLVLALSRPDVRVVCIHDSTQSLLNLIKNYSMLPPELIKLTAKCLCNFVAERKCTEWLLQNCGTTSNSFSESAYSLCTQCLVDDDKELKEIGCGISSALLQSGQAVDDFALHIGAAVIEIIISKTYSDQSEELLWFSFCKCAHLNEQIVDLARMFGLDLKTEEEKCPSIVKYTKSIQHLFI